MSYRVKIDFIQKRLEAEITYYQWVPPVSILHKSTAGRYRPVRVADGPITARCRFIKNASWALILIFQAFLFKLPNVIRKALNRSSGLDLDKICKLTDDTQLSSFDNRKRTINNLAFFMDSWLHTNKSCKNNILVRTNAQLSRLFCFFCDRRQGKYLTAWYLSIKVIYVSNVIVQFLILNAFMATEYTLYRLEYFNTLSNGEGFKDKPRFPKVSICDFKIRNFRISRDGPCSAFGLSVSLTETYLLSCGFGFSL